MNSNRPKEAISRALITAGSLALLGAAQRLLRRRVVVWGATRDEVPNRDEVPDRSPGHVLLDEERIGATRAVTVDVPPEAIWPSLVQMGLGDGGARMYDWIERLLWLDVRVADGTTPELSDLRDGDDTRSCPTASGLGVEVEILTPVGAMTTRSEDGTWVWTFLLVPQDALPRLRSQARASANSPAEVVGWLRWRSERG